MAPLLRVLPLLLLVAISCGCSSDYGSATPPLSDRVVPIEIDGTAIYVPEAWGEVRPGDKRPWRNATIAGTRGWGQFEPRLGPLQGSAERLPLNGMYRASSVGQTVDERDTFFTLTITFEFPLPENDGGYWGKREGVFPFRLDQLSLSFRSPAEKPLIYIGLLNGLDPNDGSDVGDGWREVTRVFDKRPLKLRFDAADWQQHGGRMPRRLAASFGEPFWSHHLALSPERWAIDFDTQALPKSRWRERYVTAQALYEWLRTPPSKRDPNRRFTWWSDLRDRPKK